MNDLKFQGDFTLENVPPNFIDTSWCKMRSPNKESVAYVELKESINNEGIQHTLVLRRIGQTLSLIDGYHRLEVARDLNLAEIPCKVLDECSDTRALALQIQLNYHRIPASSAKYTRAIGMLAEMTEKKSLAEISSMLAMPVADVRVLLKLSNLPLSVAQLVDDGIISASKAVILVRLPQGEIEHWVEDAKNQTLKNLTILVKNRIRELKSGASKPVKEFKPGARYIGHAVCREEIKSGRCAKVYKYSGSELEAFNQGIKFAMGLDDLQYEERIKNHVVEMTEIEKLKRERSERTARKKIEKHREAIRQLEEKDLKGIK